VKIPKSLNLKDSDLARMQDNLVSAISQISRVPILDGVLIEGISLISGSDNQVSHKLGRIPRMWLLADQSANANVWRTAWSNTLLTLRSSANCTVSLWVA
jgi:hypothetical protein